MYNTRPESGATLSHLSQQRICHLQSAIHAACRSAVDVVLARYAKRRYTYNLEIILQLHGTLEFAGHTKRLCGVGKFGFINALLFDPSQNAGIGVQGSALAMDGLEHLAV